VVPYDTMSAVELSLSWNVPMLLGGLQTADGKAEAAEVVWSLVDQLTIAPDAEALAIVLRSDPAVCSGRGKPDVFSEAGFWGPCYRKTR
jgi:hypothetical protein